MSRETITADFWGTLARWIVALVASAAPAAALSGHDGTRPVPAPQVGAPALQEVLEEVPGPSRAPRSASALPLRVGPGFSVRRWALAGSGLPSLSPPSSTLT